MEVPEVSNSVAATLAFGFAIIVCFGGTTNALVLITQVKYYKKLLRESKEILTFSLTIGDFVMSLFVTPLAFSSAVAKKWTTGKDGCVVYGLITTWVGLSSILQLACIALERYFTLSRLNRSESYKKRTFQGIVGCWLISLLASTLPLFGYSKYSPEGYGLHCSIVWNGSFVWYCLSLLFFFYILPIVIIAISYAKMFAVVRKIHRNATITWGSNALATKQSYAAQVKFTKQLVVVTCGFLIAWTPYAVMSSLRVLTDMQFDSGWYELPALFAKTANIYNPVIYFFMYRRLRRHVLKLLEETWKKTPSVRSIVLHYFQP